MSAMDDSILIIAAAGGLVLNANAAPVAEDNQILAWCLAGSVGSAVAAIAMWPPETLRGRMLMFLANTIIGLLFGPFLVQLLETHYQMRVNMANCLAASAVMSFLACSVIKPVGPVVGDKCISLLSAVTPAGLLSVLMRVWGVKSGEEIENAQLEKIQRELQQLRERQNPYHPYHQTPSYGDVDPFKPRDAPRDFP